MNINFGDILVLLILGSVIGVITAQLLRDRRNRSRCGGCSGCKNGCCGCSRQ